MPATMNAALRALAGLDIDDAPAPPAPKARARKPAKPAPPSYPDDAAWLALVTEYAALAEGVKPLIARLESLKEILKGELDGRSPADGGEGAEIRTSAGVVGMKGCDVREYVVAAHRRRSLTVR